MWNRFCRLHKPGLGALRRPYGTSYRECCVSSSQWLRKVLIRVSRSSLHYQPATRFRSGFRKRPQSCRICSQTPQKRWSLESRAGIRRQRKSLSATIDPKSTPTPRPRATHHSLRVSRLVLGRPPPPRTAKFYHERETRPLRNSPGLPLAYRLQL